MTVDELVTEVRRIARLHGWAVGVHGSLVRDIDFIAVPWIESASPWTVLAAALATILGYEEIGPPTDKPLGRKAIAMLKPGSLLKTIVYNAEGIGKTSHEPPQLDFSFIDPRSFGTTGDLGAAVESLRAHGVMSDDASEKPEATP